MKTLILTKPEIMNDVEELIFNLAVTREEVDFIYQSDKIDEEDSTLDAFIKNHDWLYISSRNLYIQADELDYNEDYSDEVKQIVLSLT